MCKIVVLIPTHLSNVNQLDSLERCLNSLILQTYKIDIYISISYENDIYKAKFLDNIYIKYKNKCNFIFNTLRLYQMEHLYKLFNIIKNKYDLILFCDDDDYYLKERVEKFYICVENICMKNISGIREIYNNPKPNDIYEYWQYGLTNKTLLDFFNIFELYKKLDLFKHKFSDMYLSRYLSISQKNKNYINMVFDKNTRLYIYDYDNINSICNNTYNNNILTRYYDNIILFIICYSSSVNNYSDILKSSIKHNNMSIDLLNVYLLDKDKDKELKSIYTFCKILYNS